MSLEAICTDFCIACKSLRLLLTDPRDAEAQRMLNILYHIIW